MVREGDGGRVQVAIRAHGRGPGGTVGGARHRQPETLHGGRHRIQGFPSAPLLRHARRYRQAPGPGDRLPDPARPAHRRTADGGPRAHVPGGPHREGWIDQMRPREGNEIGIARCEYVLGKLRRIDSIGRGDRNRDGAFESRRGEAPGRSREGVPRVRGDEPLTAKPGDVVTSMSGQTIEILNTDAEGRMILADALSYADKYQPELVIDVATLTGAAANAIGHYGVVAMGNTPEKTMNKLKESGNNTFERIVEFPFWDEYNEQLKSSIADLTNLGNGAGGAITAGKFLENFTNAPYIHLDIAGPAFIKKQINYLSQGCTGVGVRLLYDFVKNY